MQVNIRYHCWILWDKGNSEKSEHLPKKCEFSHRPFEHWDQKDGQSLGKNDWTTSNLKEKQGMTPICFSH